MGRVAWRHVAQPKKKKAALPWVRWLTLLTVPVLWSVLSHAGLLDFFENRTIDWRFVGLGEIEPPLNVVYVDIDARSIEEIGNFPWTRHHFARVTAALVNQAHV